MQENPVFNLDIIFIEVIKNLNYKDYVKLKLTNKNNLNIIKKYSNYILKNIIKNTGYKLYENKHSFNFKKKILQYQ